MKTTHYIFGALLCALLVFPIAKFCLTSSVGCNAFSRSADQFMAYCPNVLHGFYDSAAILFNTEDGVTDAVQQANILMLGESREQFAFSSSALDTFRTAHPEAKPYLLGFGGGEQDLFSAEILRRLHPHPKMAVINVAPFFTHAYTPVTQGLIENPLSERATVAAKKAWHTISALACQGKLPFGNARICGKVLTIYRTRSEGRWLFSEPLEGKIPVRYLDAHSLPRAEADVYVDNAKSYFAVLGVPPSCIVLTDIPWADTDDSVAQFVAQHTGSHFVSPHLTDLQVIWDRSHLSEESRVRWTNAFFAEIEPITAACLNGKASR